MEPHCITRYYRFPLLSVSTVMAYRIQDRRENCVLYLIRFSPNLRTAGNGALRRILLETVSFVRLAERSRFFRTNYATISRRKYETFCRNIGNAKFLLPSETARAFSRNFKSISSKGNSFRFRPNICRRQRSIRGSFFAFERWRFKLDFGNSTFRSHTIIVLRKIRVWQRARNQLLI